MIQKMCAGGESPSCACTYFLLAVVGNIGAGKSTFLERIRGIAQPASSAGASQEGFHGLQLAHENIDQWRIVEDSRGVKHDILDMYYRDQEAEAVRFQTNMLVRRLEQQHAMDVSMRAACPSARGEPCPQHRHLRVSERSVRCGLVFAEVLNKNGHLSALDYAIFQSMVECFDRSTRRPDAVVFLDVSAEDCNARMHVRERDAEAGVPLEYLQSLDAAYRRRFSETCATYIKNPTGSNETEEGEDTVRDLLRSIAEAASA